MSTPRDLLRRLARFFTSRPGPALALLAFGVVTACASATHYAGGWPAAASRAAPPPATAQPTPFTCPQCDLTQANLKGVDLTDANLNGANLQGVDLSGLKMNGAQLQSANLSHANLDGAQLNSSGKGPADLTGANLRDASLDGAQLDGAKLQYATLACTDFSNTDITNAHFGPILKLPSCNPRTMFRNAKMSCEFIGQWKALDLSNADVSACWANLSGVDFTGAEMPGVSLTNGDPNNPTDLRNTVWAGANLTGASFTSGLLDGANFSPAGTGPPTLLTAANLSYASAPGAKFDKAILSANHSGTHPQPGARLNFAYLARATFVGCDLSYTDFSNTILTGAPGAFSGATLDGAAFQGANLSGLDLSTAVSALGVNFSNANLNNVNLKNLNMSQNAFRACGNTVTTIGSNLAGAFLCGATLDTTNLNCANLTAAAAQPPASPRPAPAPAPCAAATLTNVKTNGIPPQGLGCFTTCPDGSPGPCAPDARWQAGGAPPLPPCCTAAGPTPTPCPPQKQPKASCTADCDCRSRQCVNNVCN